MSSAIQMTDEEVNQLMLELKEHVNNVKAAATPQERKQLEVVARQHYKKTRSSVNAFASEVRAIEDPTQKSVYTRKQQAYTDDLKRLDKELKDAINPPKVDKKVKSVTQEEMLMGEGGEDGSQFTSASQVLQAGQRVNADTLQSLTRSERLVASSEEVGQTTMETLRKQSETIERTQEQLNTLGGMLDRAKKDVSWFARQMAGDRCFMLIFMLVVLGIAVVVFWQLYKHRKEKADASTPAPPVPSLPPQSRRWY